MLIFKKITLVSLFLLAVIFLWPKIALAQNEFSSVDLTNLAVYSTRSIFDTIVGIVNIILGFLGTITVLLFLYAGYLWLTSRGSADRIDQAKKIMLNATIGIGIIFVSYALVNFIFRSAYEGIWGVGGPGGGPGGNPYYGGAVLGGVLESHYPARNATNVARNTSIVVTFREEIRLDEMLVVDTCTSNCEVERDIVMIFEAGAPETNLSQGQLMVDFDAAHKNFTFNPPDLGNDNTPVGYTVQLNNLYTGNGQQALVNNSYNWNFSVGTWIDNVMPYITSVIPVADLVNAVAPNTIVQINFSESMNPLDIPATWEGNDNITISDGPNEITGSFHVGNQYRTVEFISNDLCGQNSCGYNVFCLPQSATITGLVRELLRDMASNQLDGNNNGVDEANDDYTWQFMTNNEIDLTAPEIIARDGNTDWVVNNPIRITFDSSLSMASVNYSTVQLAPLPSGNINYWMEFVPATIPISSSFWIQHDTMAANTQYRISCGSGITDLQQNCYQCVGPVGP